MSAIVAVTGKASVPRLALPVKEVRSIILEAIREFRLWNIFDDHSFNERYEFFIRPEFDTAAWMWRDMLHRFFIGEKALNRLPAKTTREQCIKFVMKLCRHERGHGKRTERNLKVLQAKFPSVPFSVINLFEDAWMENAERVESGVPFGWAEIEAVEPAKDPYSLFFNYIQHDARIDVPIEESYLKEKPDEIAKVRAYFDEVCNNPSKMTSFKAGAVAKRFYEEFADSLRPPKGGSAGGSSSGPQTEEGLQDLSASLEISSSNIAAQEFLSGAFNEKGEEVTANGEVKNASSEEDPMGAPNRGIKNSIPEAASSIGDALNRHATSAVLDYPKLRRVAQKLSRVFEDKARWRSTDQPSKYIDVIGMALGAKPFFRPEILSKAKKTIYLLVDMSGSMRGEPSEGARELISVLNYLTQMGYVKGHVVFSSYRCHTTYKLPLADSILNRIEGHSNSEGLEAALKATLPLLKQAQHVFVYTDAHITDAPIKKRFFNTQGIFTIGMYIGSQSQADDVLDYFDKALAAPSLELLADGLVSILQK